MILLHSWKSLQTTFPTRAMEWFFGWALFNLGVVFWLNPTLFKSNDAWDSLARFAEQETWRDACLIVGFVRLAALMVNGLYWRTPLIRTVMAFASCFFWWQMSVGLIPNGALGSAIIPLFFIFDAYNGVRTGREVGVSEYVHRIRMKAGTTHGSADTGSHA